MKVAEFFDNSEWPLCSLLVSKKHRVIYTPIAKNANTSLKRLFVGLSGHTRSEEILNDNIHIHLTSNQTGLSLCDYSQEEATEILIDPGYFRYVVLRNPLMRAVSGYLDKFVRNPPSSETDLEANIVIGSAIDWVYAQRGERPDYNRSITFQEFVNYLVQTDDNNLDTHFKSQESFLGQQYFDFIGTVEQMKFLPKVLEPLFNQYIEIEHRHRVLRRKLFLRRGGKEVLLPKRLRAQRVFPHASEFLSTGITEQLKNRFSTDYEYWHSALTKRQARKSVT